MDKVLVLTYSAYWDVQHTGKVIIHSLGSGGPKVVPMDYAVNIEHANEMLLVVDLLRNEKPIFYDPASHTFSTGEEPIGQNE